RRQRRVDDGVRADRPALLARLSRLPPAGRDDQGRDQGKMTAAAALVLAAQVIAGIQIQGNTATPDEEIRKLAGVEVGMPFDDTTPAVVAERIKKGKHFDKVEVLKRYASIEDPSQIMLVIVVDEGPVKIVMTGDPEHPTRVVRKTFPNLLVLP